MVSTVNIRYKKVPKGFKFQMIFDKLKVVEKMKQIEFMYSAKTTGCKKILSTREVSKNREK